MHLEIIYIVLIIFSLTSIITACVLLKTKKRCSDEWSYFKEIYSTTEYNTIREQSRSAGKMNSPFIEGDNILDTIQNGMNIIKNSNMYEHVGESNERPFWQ